MSVRRQAQEPPPLKARLAAGERLVGALLRMPAEETVEMLGVAGLDFLVLDAEHGPGDLGTLRQHLVLAELHRMAVLVRVGRDEPALVLRALDAGAQGVVAPHVDAPEEAAAVVAAARYPPLGERGFATYGRTGRFGRVGAAEHRRDEDERTMVVVMLESPQAAARTAEILAVPGVDAYLVGPSDLGVSSGPDDPPPADSIAAIHAAAGGTGAVRLELVSSVPGASAALAAGAQLVAYNLTAVLMEVFAGLTAPVRDAGPGARGGT